MMRSTRCPFREREQGVMRMSGASLQPGARTSNATFVARYQGDGEVGPVER